MLFRSFAFARPYCKPGFADEWDMATLGGVSDDDLFERGRIFFPDVKSLTRLDWRSFDRPERGHQEPVLLKAMLGDYHAEFIALFLCEILMSQCIHFTHREAGDHLATEVFRFPNGRMIPRLLGYCGINSHPSLIINLNRKCLYDQGDPIFKEILFGNLSFSLRDLDVLLGNSAKVVMERVERFPMTARLYSEPEPADNPSCFMRGPLASQITELYYHEINDIQRSLEDLCCNVYPK